MNFIADVSATDRWRSTVVRRTLIVTALCFGVGAYAGASTQDRRAPGGCPEWNCTTNGTRLTGIVATRLGPTAVVSARVAVNVKQPQVRTRNRGGCEDWGCGSTNGTSLTGLALPTAVGDGIKASEAAVTIRTQPAGPRGTSGRGGNCPDWMCSTNGTQRTGIAVPAVEGITLKAKTKRSDFGASSHGCDDFGCGTSNGTRLSGVALPIAVGGGIKASEAAVTIRTQRAGPRGTRGGGDGCPRWICTSNGTRLTGIVATTLDPTAVVSTRVVVNIKQAPVRTRDRGGCEEWGCGATNGTPLTGQALPTAVGDGIKASEAVVTIRTQPAAPRGTSGRGCCCPDWMCTTNGTQLTGIAVPAVEGIALKAKTKGSDFSASSRNCDDYMCGSSNGTPLSGVELPGVGLQHVKPKEVEVLSMRCASARLPGCRR